MLCSHTFLTRVRNVPFAGVPPIQLRTDAKVFSWQIVFEREILMEHEQSYASPRIVYLSILLLQVIFHYAILCTVYTPSQEACAR